jgi:hypothetical protein
MPTERLATEGLTAGTMDGLRKVFDFNAFWLPRFQKAGVTLSQATVKGLEESFHRINAVKHQRKIEFFASTSKQNEATPNGLTLVDMIDTVVEQSASFLDAFMRTHVSLVNAEAERDALKVRLNTSLIFCCISCKQQCAAVGGESVLV